MADKLKRCSWCEGDELDRKYHDEEWGVPVYDDTTLFELLTLEGAQAGVSWHLVLTKRQNYKKLFANFEIDKVARFTDARLEKILLDPGVIRNRLKVFSVRSNAQALKKVQKEFGDFSTYLWAYVDGKPIVNKPRSMKEVPSKTALSDKLSKDLKMRGFKFVGGTICYAYMQGIGMVNDHQINCFRYKQLAQR